MSEDEWAHIVLVAALSFTDDTALIKKVMVPELLVCLTTLLYAFLTKHLFQYDSDQQWIALSLVSSQLERVRYLL